MTNQEREQLVKLLEQYLDELPFVEKDSDELDFSYGKTGYYIAELLDQAGYNFEAHQRGIGGTFLLMVPREKKGGDAS